VPNRGRARSDPSARRRRAAPLPRRARFRGPLAVLWTGGKDCALALHECAAAGGDLRLLATFVPPRPRFVAHPLRVMRLQARALDLPLRLLTVREPLNRGYEAALRRLRREGIREVVTGDIARVDGRPSWIRARASAVGLAVRCPLWGRPRDGLLRSLPRHRIEAVVSFVRAAGLSPGWLGRRLDRGGRAGLLRESRELGLDPAGEQGEYHTLVVFAERFRSRVRLGFGAPREAPGGWALPVTAAAFVPNGRARSNASASRPSGTRRRARPTGRRPDGSGARTGERRRARGVPAARRRP
jgi:diphthine-ammonia ligase